MLDELRKTIDRASSPGDVATILIFGTAGFVVDAGLNAVGFLSPGMVGSLSASGALGVKRAIEANLNIWRNRREAKHRITSETLRAQKFLELLEAEGHLDLARRLDQSLLLFAKQIDQDGSGLSNTIDELLVEYRNRPVRPHSISVSGIVTG